MNPSQSDSQSQSYSGKKSWGWKIKLLLLLLFLIGYPAVLGAVFLNYNYFNWGNKTIEDFEWIKSFITRTEKAHVAQHVPIKENNDDEGNGVGVKTVLEPGHRYRIIYLPENLPKDLFGSFKSDGGFGKPCILMGDNGEWSCVVDKRLAVLATWEIVQLNSDGTLLHGAVLAPKGLCTSNKEGDLILGQENMFGQVKLPFVSAVLADENLQSGQALPENPEPVVPQFVVNPYVPPNSPPVISHPTRGYPRAKPKVSSKLASKPKKK